MSYNLLKIENLKFKILPLVLFFLCFFAFYIFNFSEASAAVINKPSLYLSSNNGLVGYWTMDGKNVNWKTGAVTDSSGKGNTGFVTNMATSTSQAIGRIGQALEFDGVDDLVNAGSAASLDDLGPMTVSAWMLPRSIGEGNAARIVAKESTLDGSGAWSLITNPDNILIFSKDYATTDLTRTASKNSFVLNQWQHVAVTWDGSATAANVRIYVNGIEVSYQTTTNGVDSKNSDATLDLVIGNADGTRTFDGSIDDIRIYNRVLSANEIATLFNSGSTKFNVSPIKYLTTGLVGYWTMDGNKVNWKTGAVTDSSGKGNTGTIVNMATSTGVGVGKIGQALNFDGVDDSVNISNTIGGIQTVGFWLKATTTEKLINFNGIASIEVISGTITANNFTSPTIYVDGAVSSTIDTNWHFVTITTGTGISGSAITIGKIDAGFFKGILDDIRIYNRVLSANEIATLFNSGSTKFNVSPTKYLTTGLVGYWTMDGNKVNWKTGAVTDSSGKGNTGTIVNMATSTGVGVGKIGQALEFDGVDDLVNAGSAANIDNLSAVTVSAWIYPNSRGEGTFGRIISKRGDTAAFSGWDFFIGAAYTFVQDCGTQNLQRTTDNAQDPGAAALKKWTHILVTWNGGNAATGVNIYINGEEAAAYSTSNDCTGGQDSDAAESLVIGNSDASHERTWDGKIDDVRLYNRVLSANEVLGLYNAGR